MVYKLFPFCLEGRFDLPSTDAETKLLILFALFIHYYAKLTLNYTI